VQKYHALSFKISTFPRLASMPPNSYRPAFDDQQKELDMQSKTQHINLALTYLRREDTTGTQNTDTSQESGAASPPKVQTSAYG
jgi:hypothetical protein